MKICLAKSTLGTPGHLVWEEGGGYTWVRDVPEDAWIFGSPGCCFDLSELAHAQGGTHTWEPPKAHHRSLTELLGEDGDHLHVRWDLILPPALYKKQLQDLLQRSQELLKNSDEWKYQETFERTQKTLCDLAPVTVDRMALGIHLRTCPEGRKDELRSFQGDKQARYTRTTSTGRLTVSSGPKLLTLDKRFRNILKSRHGDQGSIIQLDYVSLEPRTLLALTGQEAPDDVYDILQSRTGAMARDKLKRATMLVLYGGGIGSLRKILDPGEDPVKIMDGIREAFKLRYLGDTLTAEHSVSGMLTNFYGRVMHPKRAQPGYLVAMYTQSTAVDVALQGFGQIREEIKDIDGIDAVGIVHDALWLDVHHSCAGYTERLREVGSTIPGFDIRFPLDEQHVSN
ncbi:hypothetical protein HN588_02615 [Candidatus Bathyarchaeota archaeon]|nr:hypothetical protein [Candidatus Bathyarchaeota archaeon]